MQTAQSEITFHEYLSAEFELLGPIGVGAMFGGIVENVGGGFPCSPFFCEIPASCGVVFPVGFGLEIGAPAPLRLGWIMLCLPRVDLPEYPGSHLNPRVALGRCAPSFDPGLSSIAPLGHLVEGLSKMAF